MQLLYWQTPTNNRVKATIRCLDGHIHLCDVFAPDQDRVTDLLREITDTFEKLPPTMADMIAALEEQGFESAPDMNPDVVFLRLTGTGPATAVADDLAPAPELDDTLSETPVDTLNPDPLAAQRNESGDAAENNGAVSEEAPKVWTIDELLEKPEDDVRDIATQRGLETEGKDKDDLAIDIVTQQGE